jgi:hypothetical protein
LPSDALTAHLAVELRRAVAAAATSAVESSLVTREPFERQLLAARAAALTRPSPIAYVTFTIAVRACRQLGLDKLACQLGERLLDACAHELLKLRPVLGERGGDCRLDGAEVGDSGRH